MTSHFMTVLKEQEELLFSSFFFFFYPPIAGQTFAFVKPAETLQTWQ